MAAAPHEEPQSEFIGQPGGAQEGVVVIDTHEHGLAAGGQPVQRRQRVVVLRTVLAGIRGVGRMGVPVPLRVEDRLPHERHDTHHGSRIGAVPVSFHAQVLKDVALQYVLIGRSGSQVDDRAAAREHAFIGHDHGRRESGTPQPFDLGLSDAVRIGGGTIRTDGRVPVGGP